MRLTVTTFLSLDGVMQAPGGVVDWFSNADAFLLGRRTYEIVAAYWPLVTDGRDSVAAGLNNLPKHVVSNTLARLEWNNSRLVEGDVAQAVTKLKQQPGRELRVHGSGQLAQRLMRHDLIDEYRLWIYPVVLGNGRRLFEAGVTPAALELVDTKTTSTGVVIHVYQPAGKPSYGSFELDEGVVNSTEAVAAAGREHRNA